MVRQRPGRRRHCYQLLALCTLLRWTSNSADCLSHRSESVIQFSSPTIRFMRPTQVVQGNASRRSEPKPVLDEGVLNPQASLNFTRQLCEGVYLLCPFTKSAYDPSNICTPAALQLCRLVCQPLSPHLFNCQSILHTEPPFRTVIHAPIDRGTGSVTKGQQGPTLPTITLSPTPSAYQMKIAPKSPLVLPPRPTT